MQVLSERQSNFYSGWSLIKPLWIDQRQFKLKGADSNQFPARLEEYVNFVASFLLIQLPSNTMQIYYGTLF